MCRNLDTFISILDQLLSGSIRAPDKVHIFISTMSISSPNPRFDSLLESSHRDDSNKWSDIGFGEEMTQAETIEVIFTHLIWSSVSENHLSTATFLF